MKKKVEFSAYKQLRAEKVNGVFDKKQSTVIVESQLLTDSFVASMNNKFKDTGIYFEPVETKKKSKKK